MRVLSVSPLRVVVADEDRRARRLLVSLLTGCDGVRLVGDAGSGEATLLTIKSEQPDVAFLGLEVRGTSGLQLVRQLPSTSLPLVTFLTTFDDAAVDTLDMHEIEYLIKPVDLRRLQATLGRLRARLARRESAEQRASALLSAVNAYEQASRRVYLSRIPVRRQGEVVILPVQQIASIMSEGPLLHITTLANERYTITHRLHLLECRLDPRRFLRLSRSTLANIDAVAKVSPRRSGSYVARLCNGQELQVSRLQWRVLRSSLLKL